MSYQSLIDRTVLITGGGSGIGEHLVRTFAEAGARVALLDIDTGAGEAVAAAVTARHQPVFLQVDLRDLTGLGEAIGDASRRVGGDFAVLVNNAGHDERHSIEDVTPDYWRDRLASNLDHHFFCAQAVIPGMRKLGGGSIVGLGSCAWRLGLGGMPAYATAKAAIEGLTRALARDLGRHRIRVNCIIPGFVKTQRQVEKWLTPALEAVILAGQCLPDFIEPVDVANLAMFLAADESRMCTSHAYNVDAGWISAGN